MKKDKSYNDIRTLDEDWGYDDREELPYSGQSIQTFIKKYLSLSAINDKEKASKVGFKNMTMYLFATAEDKSAWENLGVESWIDSAPLVIVGTERKIQVTNISGNNNPYFTTAQDKAEVTVAFRSLEKDVLATEYDEVMEDVIYTVSIDKGGTGVWNVVESNILVSYGKEYTFDLKKYLAVGVNRVIIKGVGSSTGAVGQLNLTANLTSMYIAPSNFAWNIPFIEGQPYNLGGVNIGGNLEKTLYIKMSNEAGYNKVYDVYLGTNQFINNGYYFEGLEFPIGGTGIYNVELWLDSNGVQSEHLLYNIMCISASEVNTAQLVAISSVPSKVINYMDNKLFDYVVYDKGAATASPSVLIQAIINQNPAVVVDEILVDVPTSKINTYEVGLEVESQDTRMSLIANIVMGGSVQTASYHIDNSLSYPPTDGYSFYVSPSTRNNSQENREDIINISTGKVVPTTWTKMAWADGVDGHTTDNDGRKCLALLARSKCVMQHQPMAKFGSGKTIEFTYKVRNVADYDEPIITICNEDTPFIGIKITPNNILAHSRDLRTSDLVQSIGVEDEKTVNVIITFVRDYKVTYGNLCQIYVDGGKARSFEFSTSDSWNNNANIILGSNSADLYVYGIKVYERGFDKEDAERNFVASLNLSEDKKHMYELLNSVRNDIGQVDYDAVYGKFNTMNIRMHNDAALPHKGLSKEYSAWCDVEFNFVQLPQHYQTKIWNFLLKSCLVEGQGTTSMNYWLWNLRFRIDKSDNIVIVYPDGQQVTI